MSVVTEQRVARAIFETTYLEAKPAAKRPTDAEWAEAWADVRLRSRMVSVARAAIEAMREPTPLEGATQ